MYIMYGWPVQDYFTLFDGTTYANALILILRQNTRDSMRQALDKTLNEI